MCKEYITAMREGLEKKCKILDEIYELGKLQAKLLSSDEMDYDAFDDLINDRDVSLENLDLLDEGFETLFSNVEAELKMNKDKYVDEIKLMQEKITYISDRSIAIQAQDARNKQALDNVFLRDRRNIAEGKRSVNVAMNYYKNMNGFGVNGSKYMDQKN